MSVKPIPRSVIVQGPPGPQGEQGPQGPQGPPGPVFVQQARPSAAGPWTWWVTDGAGNVVDLIVNDGGA